MTFQSYAESIQFYSCFTFTGTRLKFLSFIQTLDTPAHHHKGLIFQHYQKGQILKKIPKISYFGFVPTVYLRQYKL